MSTKAGWKWVKERVEDKMVAVNVGASEGCNKGQRNRAIAWGGCEIKEAS